jgi:tRNA(Ile)-lysidine synthase
MLERFLSYINEKKILKKEDNVLLAISGGIDSMVMLALFLRSEWSIGVGHINHHLRGEESEGDANFIKNYCANHHIPYFQLDLDPTKLNQGNMHANARIKRYQWLKKIATENNYQYIATAHHLDDDTETFMINLLRGSGLDGLDGIDFKNGNIIRPMLFATKEEISNFAQNNDISCREDSSNQKDKYLRNYLRQHVMPAIYKADQRAKVGISNSISNLKSSRILLDFLIEKYAQNIVASKGDAVYISLTEITETGVGAALLYQMIKKYGFNYNQCQNIIQSNIHTGIVFYAHEFEALVNRNHLIIRPGTSKSENLLQSITELPFVFETNKYKIVIDYAPIPDTFQTAKDTLWLDANQLHFPLTIRNWKDGDIFAPLGMQGKRQKVKDYLINRKVSQFDKENILVLESQNAIIAILMQGISEQVKLSKNSTACMVIKKIDINNDFL